MNRHARRSSKSSFISITQPESTEFRCSATTEYSPDVKMKKKKMTNTAYIPPAGIFFFNLLFIWRGRRLTYVISYLVRKFSAVCESQIILDRHVRSDKRSRSPSTGSQNRRRDRDQSYTVDESRERNREIKRPALMRDFKKQAPVTRGGGGAFFSRSRSAASKYIILFT